MVCEAESGNELMDDIYEIPAGLDPDQEKAFTGLAESHKELSSRFQTVRGLVEIPAGGNGGQKGNGHRPPRSKDTPSPLKSIRQFCIQCKGGTGEDRKPWRAVRECEVTSCPLHPFRMGTNPFHKRNPSGIQQKPGAGLSGEIQTSR